MLKGKSIIELTDVHTGKKEIYEDENLVTEAIFDVLNTNIQGAMYNNPSFDNQSGEAEYEDRGLDGSEFETERTVIDCKKTA